LQGRGDALNSVETEGQMIQRIMPGLMGIKNILVINDGGITATAKSLTRKAMRSCGDRGRPGR
jgi:hypothetical protein